MSCFPFLRPDLKVSSGSPKHLRGLRLFAAEITKTFLIGEDCSSGGEPEICPAEVDSSSEVHGSFTDLTVTDNSCEGLHLLGQRAFSTQQHQVVALLFHHVSSEEEVLKAGHKTVFDFG